MGRKKAEGDKGMKLRRNFLVISLLLCTVLGVNPFIRQLINLPEYSEKTQLTFIKPSGILAKIVSVNLTPKANSEMSQPVVTDNYSKDFQVSYKLFGIFPFKSSQIEVMPSMKLLPGGQSIGVTLQAKGVMIVGQAPVMTKAGTKIFPAKDAGIETGDTIFKINGQEVHT
ncbi:MAG: SpoIVB peptidase, partial [Desulfitobacteriaceae bacterium]